MTTENVVLCNDCASSEAEALAVAAANGLDFALFNSEQSHHYVVQNVNGQGADRFTPSNSPRLVKLWHALVKSSKGA